MKAEQLRECLATIMWDEFILSKALDQDILTVHGWTGGSREIPDEAAKWLEELANAFETVARHKPVLEDGALEEGPADATD